MRIFSFIKRRVDRCVNTYCLKKMKVSHGTNLKINGRVKIYGKKETLLWGNDLTINSGNGLIPIGFEGNCTFWTLGEGKIKVGDSCGFTNTAICSMESVEIGNHVLLGGGVKIYDTDFHSLDYKIRRDIVHDHDRKSKKVIIEDDVFVGAGSLILKGSVIGKKSIIGAGSVVSGEIPSGQIWAGNPARYIKDVK